MTLGILEICSLTTYSSGPTVMRGNAVERVLAGQKIFSSDIDNRVRKVKSLFKLLRVHCSPPL